MQTISLKELLEAGCHFGHKVDRWHPKAKAFIYQARDGIHIIDLAKTKVGLEKAAEFIRDQAKIGNSVLFVGTKRQAAAIIKEEAGRVGAPYISERWIGGFLTNWEQVHKNLEKIRRLKEEETSGAWKKFPKHERVKLARYVRRLEQFYGGVLALMEPPKAIFIVDIKREQVAEREAVRTQVPIVAIVDTNSDPTPINYVIPANDDAVGSIAYIVHYLAEAYKEGREEYDKEKSLASLPKTEEKVEKLGQKTAAPVTRDSKAAGLASEMKIDELAKVVEKTPKIKRTTKTETSVEVGVEKQLKSESVVGAQPKKKRGRPKKVA